MDCVDVRETRVRAKRHVLRVVVVEVRVHQQRCRQRDRDVGTVGHGRVAIEPCSQPNNAVGAGAATSLVANDNLRGVACVDTNRVRRSAR